MLRGRRILAVVPARSGSKGIADKNMRRLAGVTLIGWAGRVLESLKFIDARVISTDSSEYAQEGERYGLMAPFLRPRELSGDDATAVDTVRHALLEVERELEATFDVVLIVEPTSPLRTAEDLDRAAHRLIETGADSVVSVSPLPTKFHPMKLLVRDNDRLDFYSPAGRHVTGRQDLPQGLYWRNGICYALTRACLVERSAIFTERTVGDVIARPVVNIDDPMELAVAEVLLQQQPTDWGRGR